VLAKYELHALLTMEGLPRSQIACLVWYPICFAPNT
jgi:hypothetical protein